MVIESAILNELEILFFLTKKKCRRSSRSTTTMVHVSGRPGEMLNVFIFTNGPFSVRASVISMTLTS